VQRTLFAFTIGWGKAKCKTRGQDILLAQQLTDFISELYEQ